ncbi:DNA adenine methylase [Campylobacter sp. 19-13652]|uniref:DNA adenine methylase n=1 Tax=Campylobacter sp. 19-13652 TaxID=2840180 RepID=UPI001C76B7A9|nr:DNA adenine methylase [Campylobacter sp. 19-13652]BCX79354.1 restriction endonuclease subunit M [Campylobacter sp. 19-13652]
MDENIEFLKEQIITYIGNKRALLEFLGSGVKMAKDELRKSRLSFADIFSGSGIVARSFKSSASYILANDLEAYSKIINECYLSNQSELDLVLLGSLHEQISNTKILKKGIISELYAPKDDGCIKQGERVFYTTKNAALIDTIRQNIDEFSPANLKPFFIAPLLFKASVHANTAGVFKGFYKDEKGIGAYGGRAGHALNRIKGEISLPFPLFSKHDVPFDVTQLDALNLAKDMPSVDVAYLDPPYNIHPYGSNYFMLNLIASYNRPNEISKVSGIPKNWNRSEFNKANASEAFFELVARVKARFVLISYNNEGIISADEFDKNLKKLGKVRLLERRYNAFRASRNLSNREKYVKEWLYIVKKF